jgi:hypothetical protein
VPFARAVTNSVLSQRCGSNEFLHANNVWRRRVQKLPGDEVSKNETGSEDELDSVANSESRLLLLQ